MLQEIKKFALRGNVVDLAVGLIVGAAFGAIVTSLVNDVIMPPVGLLLGGVNFDNLMWVIQAGSPPPPYATPADAAAASAVTINYGHFINTIITFLIVTLVVFFLVKGINRLKEMQNKPVEPETPTTRECPFCAQEISLKAKRCPFCTSDLV
jgi:large conductance mechanosensitive channel